MKDAPLLGEFEQLVLLAVWRLGDNAYGATIRTELAERAGREVSVGALYTTLERLEDKGLLSSRMGEATAVRGGRPKRFLKVTQSGHQGLARSHASYMRMIEGLPSPVFGHG